MSSPVTSIFFCKFLNIFIINPCLLIPTFGLPLNLLLLTICFPFGKCHVLLRFYYLASFDCIPGIIDDSCRNSRFSYLPLKSVEFCFGYSVKLSQQITWILGGLVLGFVRVGLLQFCPLSWEIVFAPKVWPSGISMESSMYFTSPSDLVDLELLNCLLLLGNCWNLCLALLAFSSWLLEVTPRQRTQQSNKDLRGVCMLMAWLLFCGHSFLCFPTSISRHCGSYTL